MFSKLQNLFPILKWSKNYNKSFLRLDVIAGITVAAVAIPEAIAYSSLAGLPPQTGLYAALAALIAYFIFGTSNQLSIGPTSSLAILVGSTLGTLTIINPSNMITLSAFVALLVGIISIAAWALRMGFIVKFISPTVLTGFLAGAAFYISATQISNLFGIEGATGGFFDRIIYIAFHIGETHIMTLIVGLIAIIYLLFSEKYFSKVPNALIIVIIPIILFSTLDLSSYGLILVGNIPSGLSPIVIPKVPLSDLSILLNLALACFLLSYVEGTGAAKKLAMNNDEEVDENKELLALGSANALSGLTQGLPVGGSLSRSAINDDIGSKSPLSSGISALVLIFVILFFAGIFSNLPEVILGSIILVVIKHLIKVDEFKKYYKISKREFIYAMVTFFGVLFFGMLQGMLIGVAISFLGIIYNIYHPKIVELGRVKDTTSYKNIKHHSPEETNPEILILRIDSAQLFVNADNIKCELLKKVNRTKNISLVVLDMGNTDYLDIVGVENLEEIYNKLKDKGIEFRLAEITGPAREMIVKMGFSKDLFLYKGIYPTVNDVITEWENSKK